MPWPQEPTSYEGRARQVARRIARASNRRELRAALREGLEVHRRRGRMSFLLVHRYSVYKVLLTKRERADVRAEVRRWPSQRELIREVLAAEGEQAAREARLWSQHHSGLHFPWSGCGWCYALLLDAVLRRRAVTAASGNPMNLPKGGEPHEPWGHRG